MFAEQSRRLRRGTWRRFGVVATAMAVAVAPLAGLGPANAFDVVQDRIVSDNPADWTPRILDDPGSVRHFAQVGDKIVAGGNFSQVAEAGSNTPIPRLNAFAFDPTTGQVDPGFAPQLDGIVHSVVGAASGDAAFLGGEFKNVNGVQKISLVKVDLATGQIDPTFNPPRLNGRVFTMKMANGKLYIGGTFTKVGLNDIQAVAAFNPVTGAVDLTTDVPFSGTQNGGVTLVMRMDISPDGSRLAAVGNFTNVGGLNRAQAVVLNTGGALATVSDWHTDRYANPCGAPKYQSYMHDVQFAPDGSYFVIGTTGTYAAESLCDSTARWEMTDTPNQQPTWANLTGGDTVWSMAITGPVVYVGGHFRWQNNHYAFDRQGPGAVARSGIAALDPLTGIPFDWNPGRTTGVGVFDMFATDAGLWVGHDTDLIGQEIHPKLAFFPLAGGKIVPTVSRGGLPGTLLQFGSASTSHTNVLHRVNAGGPQIAAIDGGPIWARDTNLFPSNTHNSGSNPRTFGTVLSAIDKSVPNTTPDEVFATDRMDPSGGNEMAWHFPVAAGTPVEVRLYFANKDGTTASSGQRLFDVKLDGKATLEKYDVVYNVGHNVAMMRNVVTTSDGSVDLQFLHRVNNPYINAIEIVRTCGQRGATTPSDRVTSRTYDGGTTFGPTQTVPSTGTAWSQARGVFMISGTVYAGFSDGNLCARSFNGTSFGPPRPIELYRNTHVRTTRVVADGDLAKTTAMFWDNNRIYYTVAGKPSLFYRYFSPQSEILGAQQLRATFSGGNIEYENVRGMVLSQDPGGSGKTYLYFTLASGVMKRIEWNGSATVPFTDQTLSGPAIDGINWQQQGLALLVP